MRTNNVIILHTLLNSTLTRLTTYIQYTYYINYIHCKHNTRVYTPYASISSAYCGVVFDEGYSHSLLKQHLMAFLVPVQQR